MTTPLDHATREARWARIRDELLQHAAALAGQGFLAARPLRRGVGWSVRWRQDEGGRRTCRRLYLGDDAELVDRTKQLLDELRAHERARRELDRLARQARVAAGLVRRHAGRVRQPSVVRRVGRRGRHPGRK